MGQTVFLYIISYRYHFQGEWILYLIAFVVIVLITLYQHIKKKLKQEDDKKRMQHLRDNTEKIIIPYDKIKIIGTKSSRSVPVTNDWRAQAFNTVFDAANSEKYEVHEYFHLEARLSNRLYKSSSVGIDRKVLEIKLYMQKEIHVYYDRDTNRYVFDLDFLSE